MIPKSVPFLIHSRKCDFLPAPPATGSPEWTTNKTLLEQILCCWGIGAMGLWKVALVREHVLLMPATFHFLSH